jgi:hypothetical protein
MAERGRSPDGNDERNGHDGQGLLTVVAADLCCRAAPPGPGAEQEQMGRPVEHSQDRRCDPCRESPVLPRLDTRRRVLPRLRPLSGVHDQGVGIRGEGHRGFLRKAGQLPVRRGSRDAALALNEAEKRLAEGAAVVIYPEGTATRDPARWPMAAKTGVARLALATGVPVIPVAHWGTQDILPYGEKKPKLLPRKTVHVVAGRPVDLSRWAGQQRSAKALRAATDAIMAEIAALVGQLRGETLPPVQYDLKTPD